MNIFVLIIQYLLDVSIHTATYTRIENGISRRGKKSLKSSYQNKEDGQRIRHTVTLI